MSLQRVGQKPPILALLVFAKTVKLTFNTDDEIAELIVEPELASPDECGLVIFYV